MTNLEASDLDAYLPRDKHDCERVEALVAFGYPAVAPVVSAMLEWCVDGNWPVARVLEPFLASVGLPLVPEIRTVLASGDEGWIYFVLSGIVAPSRALAEALRPELQRLCTAPTAREAAEGLHEMAQEILDDG